MPYLNWKDREIRRSIDPHPDARSTLTLSLSAEQRLELVSFLQGVYAEAGPELRLDLPGNWIIFWKSRDSESRLLLAHPQREEWVATVALEGDHGRRLLESLKTLGEPGRSDAVSISELGAVGTVSNVEILILCNG